MMKHLRPDIASNHAPTLRVVTVIAVDCLSDPLRFASLLFAVSCNIHTAKCMKVRSLVSLNCDNLSSRRSLHLSWRSVLFSRT